MKETRILMGMPVTVEIVDAASNAGIRTSTGAGIDPGAGANAEKIIRSVFEYFKYVDEKFSTYKSASEIMAINRGELAKERWSEDMKTIFELSEETKQLTDGYFDIRMPNGQYDPSGMVKGWAIRNAAQIIKRAGYKNFYVDAGGDIQTSGVNADGEKWSVGIKNPWNDVENIKVVYLSGEGIATSGTYIRGDHIYNPKTGAAANEIASLTVIGPNIYEADRFATAAFAMGQNAIQFVEKMRAKGPGNQPYDVEGYMIDNEKMATLTSGFIKYTRE